MRRFIVLALSLATLTAQAATFNLFAPATGVLKGSSSTYVTTAAASSDIRVLWTGTCNSGTFLRGDGVCSAGAVGTVTSVALTVPTGFSISGSPITSSGTLAITTALSGVLKGNGSGFTTAASSDVTALWSGTCNSGTYLRGDGSCSSPGSGSPGGSTTQVQYNNAGSFAGDSGFTYNGAGTVSATTFSGAHSGNGSALTTLNGTNISSGTVADARLSANVPLLNASNIFSSSGASIIQTVKNTLNTGYTSVRLLNDQNSAVRSLELDYSGSSYAPALITNGPTGESAAIASTGNFPLSIATNNTERIRIDGAGASINLKATSVQVNGVSVATCSAQLATGGASAGTFTGGSCPFTGTSTSRGSAGTYTFNFTLANSTANLTFVCTPRAVSPSNITLWETTVSGTSITFQTISNTSGLAADTTANLFCIVSL